MTINKNTDKDMDENLDNSADSAHGQIVLYQTEDGISRIECRLIEGSIWLSQMQIGEIFQRSKQTISEHLSNIFSEEELDEAAVVRNFRTTAADNKNYDVAYYNLDAILAVGFRVKSPRGTQFRRWANTQLKELIAAEIVVARADSAAPNMALSTWRGSRVRKQDILIA